ncbi:MAG: T9SS type A sorting domain-containing protein [Saprospiraceae bacterium]|nr:T9SS type A sorting domain-containing protein [Saprospiraceae bacterium]MDW8484138.1 T9SS type A sorting domain-containing protein [Saprospiraceae bacterium]
MSSRNIAAYPNQTTTSGSIELLQNGPNPFIEMTLLWFKLPAKGRVVLRVFDSEGREVYTYNNLFDKGENHILLRRSDLKEPGIYAYQVESEYGIARRHLVMY